MFCVGRVTQLLASSIILLRTFCGTVAGPKSQSQCSKDYGGLGLVNLNKKDQAIKIGWIFHKDAYAQRMLTMVVPPELGTLFWDCQLKHSDHVLHVINRNVPDFCIQICIAWFAFSWMEDQAMSPDTIYSQILWCNSNILRDGKPWKPNQNTNQGTLPIS